MAARRLLIILLVLLGISTLAAALIPPRSLREEGETGATTTAPSTTTPTTAATPPTVGASLMARVIVGSKPAPVVGCSPKQQRRRRCEPIRVGDRMTLRVKSRRPVALEIPSFGLIAFAAPNAPARFELLFESAENYGIRFVDTGRIAARIQVLPARGKPKRRAREGSGPA